MKIMSRLAASRQYAEGVIYLLTDQFIALRSQATFQDRTRPVTEQLRKQTDAVGPDDPRGVVYERLDIGGKPGFGTMATNQFEGHPDHLIIRVIKRRNYLRANCVTV